eukprot:2044406-Rhodomonas_salina.4
MERARQRAGELESWRKLAREREPAWKRAEAGGRVLGKHHSRALPKGERERKESATAAKMREEEGVRRDALSGASMLLLGQQQRQRRVREAC